MQYLHSFMLGQLPRQSGQDLAKCFPQDRRSAWSNSPSISNLIVWFVFLSLSSFSTLQNLNSSQAIAIAKLNFFFLSWLLPWSSLEEKWTPLAPQWVLNLCTSISLDLYLYFLAYWSYISLAMISWFIFWMIMYVLFWGYLVLFAVFGLYSLCTFCRLSFFGNSILMFSFFDWYGLVFSYLCCLSDIPLALPTVSFTLPPPMSGTSS